MQHRHKSHQSAMEGTEDTINTSEYCDKTAERNLQPPLFSSVLSTCLRMLTKLVGNM
jgi:hypothetical protein